MKRIVLLALLALALPLAASASSTDFSSRAGTLTGSSAGLSLAGATLIGVDGFPGLGPITGNNLGTVSFSTGSMISGSLQMGGTFNGGGTFTIAGNGTQGLPTNLFSGTFVGPVSWTMQTVGGLHWYYLTGTIQGTWYNGTTVDGGTTLTVYTGKGFFPNGSLNLAHRGSGDTIISSGGSTVPEPGTLGLLGTGLLGLAAVLHRKLKVV